MNNALMFSKASDEWGTPQDFWNLLDAEFNFAIDLAATKENRKVQLYMGPDRADGWTDALLVDWTQAREGRPGWLNPPYSKCREFIGKAAGEAKCGATIVCLVPSRTDTRWWHEHVWDNVRHQPRPSVEVRFLKGRLTFGGALAGAPFPSVVIVFLAAPRGAHS